MLKSIKELLSQLTQSPKNNALSKHYQQKLLKTDNAVELAAIISTLSLLSFTDSEKEE